MKKILLISAIASTTFLMAYNINIPNIKNSKIVIGLEETKIRNSNLKSGTMFTIGCEHSINNLILQSKGLNKTLGIKVNYGKMEYEDNNDKVSDFKIATYGEVGKKIPLKVGALSPYIGVQVNIHFIEGLNNKGIGIGPYVGTKYTFDNLSLKLQAGAAKDWFEGGKFYTETTMGTYISYNF